MTSRRLGLLFAALIIALAAIGPWLLPDPISAGSDGLRLTPPSLHHWLGTDPFGRDVLARLAHGARLSLAVASLAIGLALAVGIALGVAAGGLGGSAARWLSRGIDLVLTLPRIVLLLVLVAVTGPLGPVALGAVLGLTGWPAIARLTRGEAQRLRHAPHVLAATAIGATTTRRLWGDIFPGTLGPALVAATLGVADVLLLEAGLSFLGIGIQPPTPTWGGMILEAQPYLATAPWLLLAPGAALVTATAAATLLGEALRARLQPAVR
jgi:peptide/nickel transport system permease protein